MTEPAHQRIETLAREFVARLQQIARDELLAALTGGAGAGAARGGGRPTRIAAAVRTGGGKRDPEELKGLGDQFLAYVTKHPGMRIEQVNAELGTSTRELALPIRKLIASKAIRVTGTRRATRYYAAGAAPAARATRAKKTRRGRRK